MTDAPSPGGAQPSRFERELSHRLQQFPGADRTLSFDQRIEVFMSPDRIHVLTERLPEHPDAHDRIDLTWATHPTPIGEVLLALREHVLIRVAFDQEGFDAVLAQLSRECGARTVRSARATDPVRQELDEYFAGERTQFEVPHSLQLTHAPFRRRVQETLSEIGFGERRSYREVAEASGSPKAVRAVGSACATNPLPIVVPCHRVVRGDGSSGNYLGGPAAKEFLLSHETTVRDRCGVA